MNSGKQVVAAGSRMSRRAISIRFSVAQRYLTSALLSDLLLLDLFCTLAPVRRHIMRKGSVGSLPRFLPWPSSAARARFKTKIMQYG